jgi:hypothetical protein
MAKPFEVSAIKYSHREQKAEEWGKVITVDYYKTWWYGYEREWTIEPESNFNDTEEMRLLLRQAIHTGKIINCIGCRKSARITLKSIASLESNLLTVPSLAKISDESGNIINGPSSLEVDSPMSLAQAVPIRFTNSGKDYCVLYALLNLIDHTTEKDRLSLLRCGPLKGLKMFNLNELAGKLS